MPRAFLITNRRYKTTAEDYSSSNGPELCPANKTLQYKRPTPVSVFQAFCDGIDHLSNLQQLAEISLATALHRDWILPSETGHGHQLKDEDEDNDDDTAVEECNEDGCLTIEDAALEDDVVGDDDDDDDVVGDDDEDDGVDEAGLDEFDMEMETNETDKSSSLWNNNNNNNGSNSMDSLDGNVCPECGKQYSTSSNLARHRQTHRSISDKKAKKCPHCDKVYVSMPAYSMHIRTHGQGCMCPFCGKCFSRPWLLQGHIRTHTGEKPFKCSMCGKAFADKSNLRAHVQTHSNVKPYVCQRCGKTFALKSYLYKHEESSCMKSQKEKYN